ncbi:hypothetical protein I352_02444, partial [Cryptococcus deuterogattii MMRL2647]
RPKSGKAAADSILQQPKHSPATKHKIETSRSQSR